ncbi:MAG: agmatinase [Acidobacteriota bacterium]
MDTSSLKPRQVVMLGVPWDEHSSYLRGPAEAPPLIREALHSHAGNPWTETGVDLSSAERLHDLGDLDLAGAGGLDLGSGSAFAPAPFETIEGTVDGLLAQGHRVLSLGGDHAVSYPILRAYGHRHEGLTILQIDAHPDLYDEFEGNRLSHACPFARVMEEGLARRLVQVGIRTATDLQRRQAARFGVEIVEMKDLRSAPDLVEGLALEGPLYLSFDLDGLDPAFAPGVSHREPGGLSVRDALSILHGIGAADVPLVGADVVEYNPRQDLGGVTATVAAKLVKEISALLLRSA